MLSRRVATVETIDSPALLTERDRLHSNLARMAGAATRDRFSLRPHAKTHKSV